MATASTRPCPPLTMCLTTAMSQTTQSIPDLSWVCSDIYIFPTSFHIFSVRYISSKYFRPEQFSAPGVCVWVLSRSQNAVGPLVAPSPLSPGPAPVLSPGSLFSSQTSETSNSEQFTTNTLPPISAQTIAKVLLVTQTVFSTSIHSFCFWENQWFLPRAQCVFVVCW